MRAAIRKAAPHATEGISYKIPFYDYRGWLAWFSYRSTYIGLYLRPPVISQHRRELRSYFTTKSAVHFPLDQKLPLSLITKLVMARVRMNEAEKKGE